MTYTERKRYEQLDVARDICSKAYDDVGHKSISAITRKLTKLRDYLNKEFPIKAKGEADKPVRSLRNCDLPLEVDDPANNIADKAWIAFRRHNPDAYFDVPGLLRCINWLLSPAKEQKRGAK